MNIIKYPTEDAVRDAMAADEPLMVLISFDGSEAIMYAAKGICDSNDDNYLRFFRIILDKSGADWTFVCPPDYKNIPSEDKRIEDFYKEGFTAISDFLLSIGYLVGIDIPKRYRRHLNVLSEDNCK